MLPDPLGTRDWNPLTAVGRGHRCVTPSRSVRFGLTVIKFGQYFDSTENRLLWGTHTRRHSSKQRTSFEYRDRPGQASGTSSEGLPSEIPRTPTAILSKPFRFHHLPSCHACNQPLFLLPPKQREIIAIRRETQKTHTAPKCTHLLECPHVAVNSFRARRPSHIPRLRHPALYFIRAVGNLQLAATQGVRGLD